MHNQSVYERVGSGPPGARLMGLLLLAVFAVAITACARAEQDTSPNGTPAHSPASTSSPSVIALSAARLDELTSEYRDSCQSPGAVIGVRLADGTTQIATAGEFAPNVPLEDDSQFLAGSVTKLFVATLAYQLIDAQRLSPNDRVAQFLPDWTNGDRITVEMLLGHRSGMTDFGNDFSDELRDLVLADLTRVFTYDEVLGLIAKQPPVAEPGSTFHYSNANTIVLGAIVQQLLGTTLGAAMRTRIFEPLNLDATIYAPDELEPLREVVFHGLYDVAGTGDPIDIGGFPREAAITVDPAGAGVISNTQDMLTFVDALYRTDRLLPGPRRMELAATVNTVTSEGIGLDARFDLRGHGGVSPGAQTMAAHDLLTGTSVVVWCNRLDRPANAGSTLIAMQHTFAALWEAR